MKSMLSPRLIVSILILLVSITASAGENACGTDDVQTIFGTEVSEVFTCQDGEWVKSGEIGDEVFQVGISITDEAGLLISEMSVNVLEGDYVSSGIQSLSTEQSEDQPFVGHLLRLHATRSNEGVVLDILGGFGGVLDSDKQAAAPSYWKQEIRQRVLLKDGKPATIPSGQTLPNGKVIARNLTVTLQPMGSLTKTDA